MGYSTHTGLILENQEFLRELKKRLSEGDVILTIQGNVSAEQYRLRRILAACDRHPEILDGEFEGMGRSSTISVRDYETLWVKVKASIGVTATIRKPDERDAITSLKEFTGDMQILVFVPSASFNEEEFEEDLINVGWVLHKNSRINDGEEVTYGVERLQETAHGFDFLE